MIETSLQIANLMSSNCMSAPDMTHALKTLGNGNMHQGFIRIGKYFSNEIINASLHGLKTGRLQGCLIGATGTLVIGGISLYAYNKKQKAKALDNEGHEILNTMNQCITSDKDLSETDDKPYITDDNTHE